MYQQKSIRFGRKTKIVNPFINHIHIITNSNHTIDCIRKFGNTNNSLFLKILTTCLINRASN
jgi:hypothetical protein